MTNDSNDAIHAARREAGQAQVARPTPRSAGEQPGDVIDRYELVEEIGQGGMGTVWRAIQEEPVRREVALKVIKLGMDTREVTARFGAERQALALMDHPYIAKVLDGGATESGRPFFVMELVHGTPITQYCDEAGLGLRDRLELFTKVCEALQHAHQKGIIHRDVKPSNVMVTLQDGVAQPKVIDFGIAKATSAELTQRTLFTQSAQVIGTPEYMSPEQAEPGCRDIDTRADVYSLGVLLYELLTGTIPFDIREALAAGYDELMRTIREVEPPKPSTRVSALRGEAARIATNRHVNVETLSRRLRGDLDWIVMKALEKDRERRYESASGLALDVERYLNQETVLAAPPSAAYRLRKLVYRRKKAVAVTAAFLVLLVAGSVGTGVGWWKTRRANDALSVSLSKEKQERERAEKNERLADERRALAEHHADLALKSLQFVITDTKKGLQDVPGAKDLQRTLLEQLIGRFRELDVELAGGELGEAYPTLMTMKYDLSRALHDLGDRDAAVELIEDAHEMALRRLELKGENDITRHNLVLVLERLASIVGDADGDLERSISIRRQALAALPLAEGAVGSEFGTACKDHQLHLAGIHQNLAVDLLRKGRLAEAREHFMAGLEGRARSLERIRSEPGFDELPSSGKDQKTHSAQLGYDTCQIAVAYVQVRMGEVEAAMDLYEEAIASRREVAERYPLEERPQMSELHATLAGYLQNCGLSQLLLDRPDAAEPYLEEALAIYQRIAELRRDLSLMRFLATAYYTMGVLRDVQGREAEARAAFESCRELRRDHAQSSPTEKHKRSLMLALARCGDADEALALADELGEDTIVNPDRQLDRARCYAQLSRSAMGQSERADFAELALDALKKSVDEGYQDPFRLRALQDLDPLHEMPRFEEIVGQIEAKATSEGGR